MTGFLSHGEADQILWHDYNGGLADRYLFGQPDSQKKLIVQYREPKG